MAKYTKMTKKKKRHIFSEKTYACKGTKEQRRKSRIHSETFYFKFKKKEKAFELLLTFKDS